MTKPVGEARILGDFRPGTRLQQYGRAYAMEARDGRYFISVAQGTRPAEKFEVNYTLGARRFQGYLSKLPDGRIYVLPVFWHNETGRWIDWKEITPDSRRSGSRSPADLERDLRQLPRDQSRQKFQPRDQHVRHHVDRNGRRGAKRVTVRARRTSR